MWTLASYLFKKHRNDVISVTWTTGSIPRSKILNRFTSITWDTQDNLIHWNCVPLHTSWGIKHDILYYSFKIFIIPLCCISISSGDAAGLRYPAGSAGERSLMLVTGCNGVTRRRSSRTGISARAARVRRPPSGVTAPSIGAGIKDITINNYPIGDIYLHDWCSGWALCNVSIKCYSGSKWDVYL